MKYVLVFLVIFLSVAVNLPEDFLNDLGFSPRYLIAALGAWIAAGLLSSKRMLLIVAVAGMALLANLPEATLSSLGVDRVWLIGALVVIVLSPLFTARGST